jgi:hypothetical protein
VSIAITSWRLLDKHVSTFAASFAAENTGKMSAAKMAMIAITTNSSMIVNPASICRVKMGE